MTMRSANTELIRTPQAHFDNLREGDRRTEARDAGRNGICLIDLCSCLSALGRPETTFY